MSRRLIGIVLLLVGSLTLGVLSGQFYFRIYTRTVPAAVLTTFNTSTAHGYFLWRGLQVGLVFFLWALLAVGLARMFRRNDRGGRIEPKPPLDPI
jgi:hypothetical protein